MYWSGMMQAHGGRGDVCHGPYHHIRSISHHHDVRGYQVIMSYLIGLRLASISLGGVS